MGERRHDFRTSFFLKPCRLEGNSLNDNNNTAVSLASVEIVTENTYIPKKNPFHIVSPWALPLKGIN